MGKRPNIYQQAMSRRAAAEAEGRDNTLRRGVSRQEQEGAEGDAGVVDIRHEIKWESSQEKGNAFVEIL